MRASKLARITVTVGVVALLGCATKSITKPRSEILKEAEGQGLSLPNAEEEKQMFLESEQAQKEKLISVIRQRANDGTMDASYIIGPQDEIEVSVFDVPELNLSSKVNQAGFISLPLVGAVPAAGYTESKLREELAHRLSSYVRNPQVSIGIAHYGSQKVAVMGAVRKPGTYALKKGSNSMLELVSQAGGVNEKAGNYMNFIPAELSGLSATNDAEARARLALDAEAPDRLKGSAIEIPLDRVLGTSGGIPVEVPVRGGDMIVIPEAGKVMVEGEVEKVGSYDLGQQMTLLGSLAAAGGITYGAKFDEVEVIREIAPGEKAHLVVNLEKLSRGEEHDIKLRNGDIVRVPSDSGRRMSQDTWEGFTKLINFGIGGSVNMGP
ncbi:MAG: polysaccharide export protein [Oligoflexia bacterium]|nr:polysaccharide export protein [Oligoflexia bacterium]